MRTALVGLSIILGATGAAAQASPDRFQIEPMEEGVLRLDRQTGAVDECIVSGEGWSCDTVLPAPTPNEAVTDTQAWRNLTAENARLESEVRQLQRRLKMIAALAGEPGDATADAAESEALMPQTARREIDRAVEVTDYAVRRFRDLFRSLAAKDTAE